MSTFALAQGPSNSSGGYQLRAMTEADRRPVVDIFNHYVEQGFGAFFEERLPYEFFDKLMSLCGRYPVLVAEDANGGVVGFGGLHAYHPAGSFRRAAEISYFISPQDTGRGLGTALLERLTEEARALGIDTLLAQVSSLNEPSLRFHERRGFVERGRLVQIGRKFGRDFDIVLMQKAI